MRTYFSDIIPKLKQFSEKLDNTTLLCNQHWVVVDEIDQQKNLYIFRPSGELLISTNGKVEKATWEYLGNQTLLIGRSEDSYLFKHGFFDSNVLALKIDSRDEYAFLVNETKFDKDINSTERVHAFLNEKYIAPALLGIQEKEEEVFEEEEKYETHYESTINIIIGIITIAFVFIMFFLKSLRTS
jgi:hypothetical protein